MWGARGGMGTAPMTPDRSVRRLPPHGPRRPGDEAREGSGARWREAAAGDPRAPALWRLRPWLVRPHQELRSEPPHLSGRHALEQSRTGAT